MILEITPKEAAAIVEAFKVWESIGLPERIWAAAEAVNEAISAKTLEDFWKEVE